MIFKNPDAKVVPARPCAHDIRSSINIKQRRKVYSEFKLYPLRLSVIAIIIFSFVFAGTAQAKIESLQFDSPQMEADYNDLVDELRCLVCQNQNLADSNAELAQDLRKQTYEMLQQGKSRDEVVDFIRLRFENELLAGGYDQGVIEAATSVDFDDLSECLARIEGLSSMRSSEDFAVLAGSFKRIRNIIKENKETTVDPTLFSEEAEKVLFATLSSVAEQVEPMIENHDYRQALATMLTMKEPVDRFFDDVMVMAELPAVRANRLNLLTALAALVLRIGDISRMHAE